MRCRSQQHPLDAQIGASQRVSNSAEDRAGRIAERSLGRSIDPTLTVWLLDGADMELLHASARKHTEKLASQTLFQKMIEGVERLAVASGLREDEAGSLVYRIGELAGLLAKEAGLSEDAALHIGISARLHDIGKAAIPDGVMLKATPLNERERSMVESHAESGAVMLQSSKIPDIKMAVDIARHHHERWDGAGYPSRLAGEDIPLAARIVAIADAFDAMTHDRCYRDAALSVEQALVEVEKQSGVAFDPVLCVHFVALVRRLAAEHDDLNELNKWLGREAENSSFNRAKTSIWASLKAPLNCVVCGDQLLWTAVSKYSLRYCGNECRGRAMQGKGTLADRAPAHLSEEDSRLLLAKSLVPVVPEEVQHQITGPAVWATQYVARTSLGLNHAQYPEVCLLPTEIRRLEQALQTLNLDRVMPFQPKLNGSDAQRANEKLGTTWNQLIVATQILNERVFMDKDATSLIVQLAANWFRYVVNLNGPLLFDPTSHMPALLKLFDALRISTQDVRVYLSDQDTEHVWFSEALTIAETANISVERIRQLPRPAAQCRLNWHWPRAAVMVTRNSSSLVRNSKQLNRLLAMIWVAYGTPTADVSTT